MLVHAKGIFRHLHQYIVRYECAHDGGIALPPRLDNVLGVLGTKAKGAQHGCAGLHSRRDEGSQCLQVRCERATL